ncbi:hypothetical protein ACWDBD_32625 [Streptomyces sp. NPDC001118]
MVDMDRPTQYVELGKVTPETAVELARMIRTAMRRAYRTVNDLAAVFEAHGLDIPDLSLEDGAIKLGDVSVETADRLACLLGAPPQQESSLDLNEWTEAHKVMDRLFLASKTITRRGFVDVQFHPDCLRCNSDAAIGLGSITVKTAKRLATALQPRA